MTVLDLKNGMICKLRNGNVYMAFADKLININGFIHLDNYLYHSLLDCNDSYFDIMKVYCTSGNTFKNMLDVERYGILIWEREKAKELTIEDIEEILGYPVKIVNGK